MSGNECFWVSPLPGSWPIVHFRDCVLAQAAHTVRACVPRPNPAGYERGNAQNLQSSHRVHRISRPKPRMDGCFFTLAFSLFHSQPPPPTKEAAQTDLAPRQSTTKELAEMDPLSGENIMLATETVLTIPKADVPLEDEVDRLAQALSLKFEKLTLIPA